MTREVLAALLAALEILIGNMERDLDQARALKAQMEAVEVLPSPPVDVATSADLTAALAAATSGDVTIRLAPGVVYSGNFVITHVGPGTLTLTTYVGLPNRRVTLADAPLMAVLTSPNGLPALKIAPGASDVRLDGFYVDGAASSDIVQIGTGSTEQHTLALVPHHVTVDRLIINGNDSGLNKRGIGLHGAHVTVTRSHIVGIWKSGQDSQAIGGWNGTGPYTITDNDLEAAGENIMFGGADPPIPGVLAEDVLIERNRIYKRLEWKGLPRVVKNLFELKAARRVTFRSNTLEGCWTDGQTGLAINIKSQNQDGACTWCVTEDVEIAYNRISKVGLGMSVLGFDYFWPNGQRTARIHVHHNFFDIDGVTYPGSGRFLKIIGGPADLVAEYNSVKMTGEAFIEAARGTKKLSDGTVVPADLATGFKFRYNVSRSGIYGAFVEFFSVDGWQAAFATDLEISGNLIGGLPSSHLSRYSWPNTFVSEADFFAGFVDYAAGDLRLLSGAAVGADFSQLPEAP